MKVILYYIFFFLLLNRACTTFDWTVKSSEIFLRYGKHPK